MHNPAKKAAELLAGPGNRKRRRAAAGVYSMVTRSWLIRLVLSGHRGGSLVGLDRRAHRPVGVVESGTGRSHGDPESLGGASLEVLNTVTMLNSVPLRSG